jgi:hypothetical protein
LRCSLPRVDLIILPFLGESIKENTFSGKMSEIISRFLKLAQRLGVGRFPSVRELLAADADGASEEVGGDATAHAFAVDGTFKHNGNRCPARTAWRCYSPYRLAEVSAGRDCETIHNAC